MGLAVVSEVVKEHGGRLMMERPRSGGARFRIILPVDPRRRRRQTKVHLLRDPDFVRAVIADLHRAGASIETVSEPLRLEELGKQLRSGGQEIFVLDGDGSLEAGLEAVRTTASKSDKES
jgi:hypothetical protein